MRPEEIRTLIAYSCWASRRVLRTAAGLDETQLHGPSWLGRGSVFAELVHILDAQLFWRQACQHGLADAEPLVSPDFHALRTFWAKEDDELTQYVEGLTEVQLSAEVSYRWPKAQPRRRALWTMLFHIVNHGTQHRGTVGAYLATIGRPVGDLDFVIFTRRRRASGS